MSSELEPLALVNCNERRVWAAVSEYIRNNHACRCRDCQLDMVALALNSIPARYIVSEEHMRFYGESTEIPDEAEITAAVRAAGERVGARPHHE
jgi:competence protein ComFB